MACTRIQIWFPHDEQGVGKCKGGGGITSWELRVYASLMRQTPSIVVDMGIGPCNIKRKLKVPSRPANMALILLESAVMDASIAAKTAEAVGPARLLQCILRLLNSAVAKLELKQAIGGCAHAV